MSTKTAYSDHLSRIAINQIRKRAEQAGFRFIIRKQGLMLEVARTEKDVEKKLRALAEDAIANVASGSKPKIEKSSRAVFIGDSTPSKTYLKKLAYSELAIDRERSPGKRKYKDQNHAKLAHKLIEEELKGQKKEVAAQEYQTVFLSIDFESG